MGCIESTENTSSPMESPRLTNKPGASLDSSSRSATPKQSSTRPHRSATEPTTLQQRSCSPPQLSSTHPPTPEAKEIHLPPTPKPDPSARQHGKAWLFHVMTLDQTDATGADSSGGCTLTFSSSASAGGRRASDARNNNNNNALTSWGTASDFISAEADSNHPHFLLAESLPGDASWGQVDSQKQPSGEPHGLAGQNSASGTGTGSEGTILLSPDVPVAGPGVQPMTPSSMQHSFFQGGRQFGSDAVDPNLRPLMGYAPSNVVSEDSGHGNNTAPICFISRTLPPSGNFVIRKKPKPADDDAF